MVYWLGVYNFAKHLPKIVASDRKTILLLYNLYCAVLNDDFSPDHLSGDEKEKLAEAVECGLIRKNGGSYKPNFAIFSNEQMEELHKIFAPLLRKTEPGFIELAKQFKKLHKTDYPQAKQSLIEHHARVDLFSMGVLFFKLAAEENKLWFPETPEEGAPLTLVIIK